MAWLRPLVIVLVAALTAVAEARADDRVALVIGNSAYAHADPVPGAARDAADLAETLRRIGFDVTFAKDVEGAQARELVHRFSTRARDAKIALVYFAGLALQVDDRNHLLMVDSKLDQPSELGRETIALDDMLTTLDRPDRLTIVLLDASRNSLIAARLRKALGPSGADRVAAGLSANLGPMSGLVGFATQPNRVVDGESASGSAYAAALIKHLPAKGTDIEIVMRRVREDVLAATKGKQRTFERNNYAGDPISLAGGDPAGVN